MVPICNGGLLQQEEGKRIITIIPITMEEFHTSRRLSRSSLISEPFNERTFQFHSSFSPLRIIQSTSSFGLLERRPLDGSGGVAMTNLIKSRLGRCGCAINQHPPRIVLVFGRSFVLDAVLVTVAI